MLGSAGKSLFSRARLSIYALQLRRRPLTTDQCHLGRCLARRLLAGLREGLSTLAPQVYFKSHGQGKERAATGASALQHAMCSDFVASIRFRSTSTCSVHCLRWQPGTQCSTAEVQPSRYSLPVSRITVDCETGRLPSSTAIQRTGSRGYECYEVGGSELIPLFELTS